MQAENNNQNPFNFNVSQCNHILNYDHYVNKNIQDIPLQKGNLFLGGVGSFK
jgi:hypothetical protein